MTKFESRTGKVNFKSEMVFNFAADMRNYNRFLPDHTIENWKADADSCSFEVSPVGKAKIRIVERDSYKTVKFAGEGLNNTEFLLWIQLKEVAENDTRVKITIKADINPVLKMMAEKPVKDFLNKLIDGIENFEEWTVIT